ncbi:hypothetical protein LMG28688_04789 [Paraburkholderia caffeinitolerans]|uniref:G-type lysozyme inhibitor n=1 Tax=Paraburkholderia caffeinitolerans TaxID=1723730 RepID=A0A6J5GKB6_9BURK|nr:MULTISPECIES: g-type lysozyme inhibitor [Paraburkholderia]CAB3798724.1 hypothetical protein LMG28688_04789 [Paraburkholderia caffeinitolerans]
MKLHHALIVLAAAFSALTLPASAADKVTTEAVHFTQGASSATMKGSFSGYDSVQYTLSARAKQTLHVKIAGSSNANFNVFSPGDVPGAAQALGAGATGTDWRGELPADGQYTVQVYQMRASARRGAKVPYTITFDIR